MKKPVWRSLTVKSNGKEAMSAAEQIKLTYQELDRGYACYVSASCEGGFDPDEAIRLLPEQEDTATYVAIQNHSPFWCSPFFGESLCQLPKKVQELLIQTEEGYICYLPICDDTFKTVIRGGEEGFSFVLYANDSKVTACREQLAYVCMEGKDPLALLKATARAAAELLDNGLALRETKTLPEPLSYLGWCSWNAFLFRVNHAGMVQKAKEFQEKGIPVKFAIFDDMWAKVPELNTVSFDSKGFQEAHRSRLVRFEGDETRFPRGMKAAVADLKAAGIPYAGIWFPTTGYWAGLDPNGEEAAHFKGDLTETPHATFYPNMPTLCVSPTKESAARYFDDLCGRVKDWGVDFVKIDNQGFHQIYREVAPIGQSARAIQTGIDRATDTHFSGALINCMGMPSECMFNRTSAVSRCSDDFVPESREWFAKNILQCSYNGILQGQYYINDWDMWWSDDEQAAKNSLCRAISGGPIYVSDELDRSRAEQFRPLCLKDGRILLCDESATPTADCLIGDPTKSGKIFKIRNRMGKNGLLAAFDIDAQNAGVLGAVSAEDTGIEQGDHVYYEYFTGACGCLNAGESLSLALSDNDDFRLYTFAPKQGEIVPLGRLDLYMGIGAVSSWDGKELILAEGGKLGFYSERLITVSDGERVYPTERQGSLTVVEVDASVRRLTVTL